jgi:hypothetical protein
VNSEYTRQQQEILDPILSEEKERTEWNKKSNKNQLLIIG